MSGSWFGTRWKNDDDGIIVTWPSFFIAPMIACFGYILTALMSFWAFMNGQWHWPILFLVVSVLATICCVQMREKFSVDRDGGRITKWPAGIPGSIEFQCGDVINAIVQLEVYYGKQTRRIGTVKVRVRTPEGIDWHEVGLDLGWRNAKLIGRALDAYVPVRVIRNE